MNNNKRISPLRKKEWKEIIQTTNEKKIEINIQIPDSNRNIKIQAKKINKKYIYNNITANSKKQLKQKIETWLAK